jgi:hypothetical protein
MPWLRIEPATSRSQVDHHHHCATCLMPLLSMLCQDEGSNLTHPGVHVTIIALHACTVHVTITALHACTAVCMCSHCYMAKGCDLYAHDHHIMQPAETSQAAAQLQMFFVQRLHEAGVGDASAQCGRALSVAATTQHANMLIYTDVQAVLAAVNKQVVARGMHRWYDSLHGCSQDNAWLRATCWLLTRRKQTSLLCCTRMCMQSLNQSAELLRQNPVYVAGRRAGPSHSHQCGVDLPGSSHLMYRNTKQTPHKSSYHGRYNRHRTYELEQMFLTTAKPVRWVYGCYRGARTQAEGGSSMAVTACCKSCSRGNTQLCW